MYEKKELKKVKILKDVGKYTENVDRFDGRKD